MEDLPEISLTLLYCSTIRINYLTVFDSLLNPSMYLVDFYNSRKSYIGEPHMISFRSSALSSLIMSPWATRKKPFLNDLNCFSREVLSNQST